MRKQTCLSSRIHPLYLLFLCLISAAPALAFSGSGAGSSADPYLITNAAQLQEMGNDLYAHYKIANDINAAETITWNSGAGFIPVGTYASRFQGSLDGNGHTITGLYINRAADYTGLFGVTETTSEVMHVCLADCSITGQTYTGILAGMNRTLIIDCCASGTVNGVNEVGGLVGQNTAYIQYSYSAGSVTGVVGVGGLAGTGGLIVDYCWSTAKVTGSNLVGGFIGLNATGTTTNSYAKGDVSGSQYVGGFVGQDAQATVINCYSTGLVTGTDPSSTGGFLGAEHSGYIGQSTYTDCFWDIMTSTQPTSYYGTGLTTEFMMQQSSFTNWDFANNTADGYEDIWTICQTTNYPKLLWQLLPGDFVCPDGVDLSDLFVFADQWLAMVLSYDIAPSNNPDGIVDLLDFAAFAELWLTTYDTSDLEAFAAEWLRHNAYSADIAPADAPDGIVNLLDFALFAENWLTGLEP